MIKGLYFKLNMEKSGDRLIYNYFNSQDSSISKIDALFGLIVSNLSKAEADKLSLMNLEKDGAHHE